MMLNKLSLIVVAMLTFGISTTFAQQYHFALTGPDNQTITEQDFPDKYLLVIFGFTSCPDVCPTTLFELKQVLAAMDEPERIQPLFITIDPLRDDAKRLNEYVGFFDKRIIGLSGPLDTIDAITKQFNASYGYSYQGKKVTPPDLPDGYVTYHSTLLYLLAPGSERELVDVYDYQAGAEILRTSIEQSIADHQSQQE